MKKKKKAEVEVMSLMSEIINVKYIYFMYKFFIILFLYTEQHVYHLKNFFIHLNN